MDHLQFLACADFAAFESLGTPSWLKAEDGRRSFHLFRRELEADTSSPPAIDAACTLRVALQATERALGSEDSSASKLCNRIDQLAAQGIPAQALLSIAAKRELNRTLCMRNVPYAWRMLSWPDGAIVIYHDDDLMHACNAIFADHPVIKSGDIVYMEPKPFADIQYYENLRPAAQQFVALSQVPSSGKGQNEFMWCDRLCVFEPAVAKKLRSAAGLLQSSPKTPTQALIHAAMTERSSLRIKPQAGKVSMLSDIRTHHSVYGRETTALVVITDLRLATADEVIPPTFLQSLAAVCKQYEQLGPRRDKWVYQLHADTSRCGLQLLVSSLPHVSPAATSRGPSPGTIQRKKRTPAKSIKLAQAQAVLDGEIRSTSGGRAGRAVSTSSWVSISSARQSASTNSWAQGSARGDSGERSSSANRRASASRSGTPVERSAAARITASAQVNAHPVKPLPSSSPKLTSMAMGRTRWAWTLLVKSLVWRLELTLICTKCSAAHRPAPWGRCQGCRLLHRHCQGLQVLWQPQNCRILFLSRSSSPCKSRIKQLLVQSQPFRRRLRKAHG